METEITGVTIDSRRAGAGTLFCAVLGAESKVHGIRYAGMAVENGAACVLCDVECEADLPFVRVADAEAALALASANLYGGLSLIVFTLIMAVVFLFVYGNLSKKIVSMEAL